MKRNQIYKLVLTALLAALTYVMTRVVQVPTVGGYTTLGDSMCLLPDWSSGRGTASWLRASAVRWSIC